MQTCEKNSSKELKHNHGKTETSKPPRRLSESVHSAEENKTDSKVEKEHKRKTSTSLHTEGTQQDIETKDQIHKQHKLTFTRIQKTELQ